MSSQAQPFVNRQKEMSDIIAALESAATGKGQFVIIKGEAGCGKTRLIEEAAAEAKNRDFAVGFGTALAESIASYKVWTEVLEAFELAHVLEEAPPPRLLGLYLLSPDGEMASKAEREDKEGLEDYIPILEKLLQSSDIQSEHSVQEGRFTMLSKEPFRLVLLQGKDLHLGAILEGQEDEMFLSEMNDLMDRVGSSSEDTSMQELLDSGKFEGIDYTKKDPKLRQSRLFENIALGLERKASIRPLCVAIDDLQWADPSSLSLLQYVARNTQNEGVAFFCTYRVEPAGIRPHLEDMLRDVEDDVASIMSVKGLSKDDMSQLVRSFVGPHALPEAFLNHLWQETQGYPLFIREVLLALEEDQAIQMKGTAKRLVRPVERLSLPKMVREVIQARLNRLPKEERDLLNVAATCGTRFTATLLAKVTKKDEGRVLNGLKAIMEVHGLLRPSGDSFAFDHSKIQEVVYEDVPSEVRQTYHRQAAEWLELTGGPIEDIAEHYYRGRDVRAAPRLRRLADMAKEKYANEEAIRFYNEALEFEESAFDRMKAYEHLGDIHCLIGNHGRSIESYDSALDLANRETEKAKILTRIGEAYESKGEYDKALKSGKKALRLVKDSGCEEESHAYSIVGLAYFRLGDFDRAVDSYECGLVIAERLGDKDIQSRCLSNVGFVYVMLGKSEIALKNFKSTLKIKEEIGDQRNIAGSLHNIAYVLAEQGQFEAALDYYTRASKISERIGHLRFLANHLENIGNIHMELSEYNKALEHHEKALTLRERTGDQEGLASSLLNVGCIHKARKEYDKALAFFERSLEILEKTSSRWWLAELHNYRGDAYLKMGNTEKALESAELALSLSIETGRKNDIGCAKNLLGRIYREQRQWQESIRNFEESIAIFEEIGALPRLADLHYQFGLMWREKPDLEKARKHLSISVEFYIELGAKQDLRKVREAYESLQIDSPHGT